MSSFTPVIIVTDDDPREAAERLDKSAAELYKAYNNGGDPATRGLNYRGDKCPMWSDLPENVRAKWRAVADVAVDVARVLYFGGVL